MASERSKHAIDRRRIIHISRRPPLQPTPKGVVSDSLGRRLKNDVPDCYSAGSAAKPFNGDKQALLPPITDFRSTVSRPNMMNLDLQSLRIFVSAIESKSLTKAAEENSLVTSGASKRIADLESRLGVDLLIRHARGVQGTPAGLSLYHHAKAILRRVEIAQDVVAEFGKAGNPKVRLAANPSSIIAYIPPITRRYLSESPTARIDLQERYSYDIPRLVAENEADVGIYHALSPAPGVTSYPFKRDRIVLVTRRDHPLARFDELFLEHANSYPFVGYFPRHTYDAFSSFAGRSLSRPLDVKIEVGNYEARCRLIQEGIGIGVIPEPNASPYLNLYNLKALKLLDEWAERQLYVCISNDRDLSDHPETKRFLDCLLAKSD